MRSRSDLGLGKYGFFHQFFFKEIMFLQITTHLRPEVCSIFFLEISESDLQSESAQVTSAIAMVMT